MGITRACLLLGMLAGLAPHAARAQSAAAPNTLPGPRAVPGPSGSLSRSAERATTFKIAVLLADAGVLSLAAGGVAGGASLTAFNLVTNWGIYTVNDYLWDSYWPAPPPGQDKTFDTEASVKRTSWKFLTYKPMVMAVKFGSIYAYTRSVRTTLVFGTASSLMNAGLFYANNMAWDAYDWYAARRYGSVTVAGSRR
jgi:uncharacterized membrane protein